MNIRQQVISPTGRLRCATSFILIAILLALRTLVTTDAGVAQPELTVYYDKLDFIQASTASQVLGFPAGRELSTNPYSENGITVAHLQGLNNTVGEFTPILGGNEFAVSEREDIVIQFSIPVTSAGFHFQDSETIGCIDNASHPDLTYPDCGGSVGGLDSSFVLTVTSGVTPLGTATFDPPVDAAFFIGVVLDDFFDTIYLRELAGGGENDFLGAVFASVNQVPAPTASAANVMLPVVIVMPTATTAPTPAPSPTSAPQLLDGYYKADLSNGGSLWFTVTNAGTLATNGGFSGQPASPWCPWQAYNFDSPASINNGMFRFVAVDIVNNRTEATMSCTASSPTTASCQAVRVGYDFGCFLQGDASRH